MAESKLILTDNQNDIVSSIMDNIVSDTPAKYMLMNGYAGTGKTTVTTELIKRCLLNGYQTNEIAMASFTNKAVRVIKNVLGDKLTKELRIETIHRLLSLEPCYVKDKHTNEVKLEFKYDINRIDWSGLRFIIFDECSTISTELMGHILYTHEEYDLNAIILFIGDKYQLPPVGEKLSIVFTMADTQEGWLKYELNEILRAKNDDLYNKYMKFIDFIPTMKSKQTLVKPDVLQSYLPGLFYNQEPRTIPKFINNYNVFLNQYFKDKELVYITHSNKSCKHINLLIKAKINRIKSKLDDNIDIDAYNNGTEYDKITILDNIQGVGENCKNLYTMQKIVCSSYGVKYDEYKSYDSWAKKKYKNPKDEELIFEKNDRVVIESHCTTIQLLEEDVNMIKEMSQNEFTKYATCMINPSKIIKTINSFDMNKFDTIVKVFNGTRDAELYSGDIFDVIDIKETKVVTSLNFIGLGVYTFDAQTLFVKSYDKNEFFVLIHIHDHRLNSVKTLIRKAYDSKGNIEAYYNYLWEFTERYPTINYGWCITAYKAQGSTYKRVMINLKNISDIFLYGIKDTKQFFKCYYTSFLRGSEDVMVYWI